MEKSVKHVTQIEIGKFRCGDHHVRLIADAELGGGSFSVIPEDKGQPVIHVGVSNPALSFVAGILLHEVIELACTTHNVRFEYSGKWNQDSADYLFLMTHPQFGRVCADAGEFIAVAMPALAKAHRLYHKKK